MTAAQAYGLITVSWESLSLNYAAEPFPNSWPMDTVWGNIYCCLKKEKSLSCFRSPWPQPSVLYQVCSALQHTAPGWLAASSRVTPCLWCISATLAFPPSSRNYLKMSSSFLPQSIYMLFFLYGRGLPISLHQPESILLLDLSVSSLFLQDLPWPLNKK